MFLPISKQDMLSRGWNSIDFLVVTGDAYVDHPSFGTAIISRVLEAEGFKVGILSAPNHKNLDAFKIFGRPKYGALVSAGNIDSMVSNYTAAKKKRSDDAYSAGGKGGNRPDYACAVYSKKIKEAYPDLPVIIGGLEASLRRFAHYDYWKDTVLPSILIDSQADLLTFGMGENQTIQIANRLAKGEDISTLTDILGTCYITENIPDKKGVFLASFEKVSSDKRAYAEAARIELEEQDHIRGKALFQKHGNKYLVQNAPMPPLTTKELDRVYALPFERYYHPIYEDMGGVPAIAEVEFSITHNRGCFGACNFCSLAFHQGRYITSRSKESVINEAKLLTENPHFKGYIHDVGGPTANFRKPSCEKQIKSGLCKNKKCLAPSPCPALKVEHNEYLDILRAMRDIPKVKKVFIRSGIRFDYLCEDKDDAFFRELVKHHISGQLKVAPEHCSAAVLDKMGKPHIESYIRFKKKYNALNKEMGKEQYLVPYLMSSHPGSRLKDAIELALFLKKERIRPQQVQDFYPTPGTISTAMFYTGIDPYTMEDIFVPKTPEDKAMQRALLQYFKPENADIVRKALIKAGRKDLIGTGANCLVPPDKNAKPTTDKGKQNRHNKTKKVSHQWQGPKGKSGKKR
ncbi:MAG: YgiQ family radical SAM protein [Clostridia bacterium]|nr:YgiQ family radical SAM protein [Clostridia bacterium]